MTEHQKEIILQLCECNMSPTNVARKMNYHRGTILYHIAKIKEQTGLDPMVFNDLVKLKAMSTDCIPITKLILNKIQAELDYSCREFPKEEVMYRKGIRYVRKIINEME